MVGFLCNMEYLFLHWISTRHETMWMEKKKRNRRSPIKEKKETIKVKSNTKRIGEICISAAMLTSTQEAYLYFYNSAPGVYHILPDIQTLVKPHVRRYILRSNVLGLGGEKRKDSMCKSLPRLFLF